MLDSEIEQSQHTGGLRFFHDDWHRLVRGSCRANHNVNYRTLSNQAAQAEITGEQRKDFQAYEKMINVSVG